MRRIKRGLVYRIMVCFLLMTVVNTISAEEPGAAEKKPASSKSAKLMDAVDDFVAAARKSDLQKLKSCFLEPDKFNADTADYSTSGDYAFRSSVFPKNKKIKCSIINYKISGNKAKVKVRFKAPYIYKAVYYGFAHCCDWIFKAGITDVNAATSKLFYYINAGIKKEGVQFSGFTTTISYKYTNGKWKISKATKALKDLTQGRVVTALGEVYDIYDKYFGDD